MSLSRRDCDPTDFYTITPLGTPVTSGCVFFKLIGRLVVRGRSKHDERPSRPPLNSSFVTCMTTTTG
jgi:hypothetical protein